MSWNYRIVKYRNKSGYGLHEVYYNPDGEPYAMTKKPATFVCGLDEGEKGIRASIILARHDAFKRPVLDEPRKWPARA